MDIWHDIRALQGRTLKTLDRNKPFQVSFVGNDSIIVTPQASGKSRPIERATIQAALDELEMRGELSRVEILKI